MEIGLHKIFLFPEKINKFINIWGSNDVDYTFPVSVELSLTNRCNFNCVWCSDKKVRNDYGGDLDKRVIFKLFKGKGNGRKNMSGLGWLFSCKPGKETIP